MLSLHHACRPHGQASARPISPRRASSLPQVFDTPRAEAISQCRITEPVAIHRNRAPCCRLCSVPEPDRSSDRPGWYLAASTSGDLTLRAPVRLRRHPGSGCHHWMFLAHWGLPGGEFRLAPTLLELHRDDVCSVLSVHRAGIDRRRRVHRSGRMARAKQCRTAPPTG